VVLDEFGPDGLRPVRLGVNAPRARERRHDMEPSAVLAGLSEHLQIGDLRPPIVDLDPQDRTVAATRPREAQLAPGLGVRDRVRDEFADHDHRVVNDVVGVPSLQGVPDEAPSTIAAPI